MPFLPPEPFLYPEHLLAGAEQTESTPARWWVLHTRPRAEKALARTFLKLEQSFFLPVYKHQRQRKGRLFCSYLPLFPGYLFLYGDHETRGQALATNLVARCIPVEFQNELHADLARVHQLITTGAPLAPEERLRPGAKVEITDGPLVGLEGTFLRRGKQSRLLVEVRLLQRGVSVELNGWNVRPLALCKLEPLAVTLG